MAAKYENLADILRQEAARIAEEGGTRLPTEIEIAEGYGVSRQTVRHALQLLEADGVISRRQGSGSYISRERVKPALRQIAVITTFIDNYIFHVVQKEFGIPCPKIRWSRWDDYAKQYLDYQL